MNINEVMWNILTKVRVNLHPKNAVKLGINFLFYRYMSENEKFTVAKNDSFQTILAQIKNNEFKLKNLEHALKNIESQNKLDGIFSSLDFNAVEFGNSENERRKVISSLIEVIGDYSFNLNEYRIIFERLCDEYVADEHSAIFGTANSISKVATRIVTANQSNIAEQEIAIYDPAFGVGQMIVSLIDSLKNKKGIKIFGNEIDTQIYNFARMNLIINGIDLDRIHLKNLNSLEKDTFKNLQADYITLDPPYAAKWSADETLLEDERFKKYGVLPPKADYAFILQGLAHLKEDGTMVAVVPHGVLFRGGKEKKIRKQLLEDGNIEAVIGLPKNLAYQTSIPLNIIVLKKKRMSRDVFFIDASQEFEKGRLQNDLESETIKKIVETYKNKKVVDGYSYLADFSDIEKNEFNLNISRYVDRYSEETQVKLEDVNAKLVELKKSVKQDNEKLVEELAKIKDVDGVNTLIELIEEK